MSTLLEKIEELKTKVTSFTNQITRILTRKAPTAGTADDSTALNGVIPSSMKTQIDSSISAHALLTNNPHGLTPVILDAPTPAAVNATAAEKLVQGILPVSQFGDLGGTIVLTGYVQFVLNFLTENPLLMWGTYYSLPAQSLDFVALFGDPANKTYKVYVEIVGGVAQYTVSETTLIETWTRFFIGTVTTNANTFTAVNLTAVTKLDHYRISKDAVGGAIPSTADLPVFNDHIGNDWLS
jgi:hypothetical protein